MWQEVLARMPRSKPVSSISCPSMIPILSRGITAEKPLCMSEKRPRTLMVMENAY